MELTNDIKIGNMDVLAFTWMTAHADTLGVVLCQDRITKLYMAYIGVADGVDETLDVIKIAENGAKLNYEQMASFFPKIAAGFWRDQYKYNS
jgi:hypothetical protein